MKSFLIGIVMLAAGCAGRTYPLAATLPADKPAPYTAFTPDPLTERYIRENLPLWVLSETRASSLYGEPAIYGERYAGGREQVAVIGHIEGMNVFGARVVKGFTVYLTRASASDAFDKDTNRGVTTYEP